MLSKYQKYIILIILTLATVRNDYSTFFMDLSYYELYNNKSYLPSYITGFMKLHDMGLVVLVKKMLVLNNFLLQNTNLVSCPTELTNFVNSESSYKLVNITMTPM